MAMQISDMSDDQLCLRALKIVHELGSLHCSYVLLKKELVELDAEVDKRLAAISKGAENND